MLNFWIGTLSRDEQYYRTGHNEVRSNNLFRVGSYKFNLCTIWRIRISYRCYPGATARLRKKSSETWYGCFALWGFLWKWNKIRLKVRTCFLSALLPYLFCYIFFNYDEHIDTSNLQNIKKSPRPYCIIVLLLKFYFPPVFFLYRNMTQISAYLW